MEVNARAEAHDAGSTEAHHFVSLAARVTGWKRDACLVPSNLAKIHGRSRSAAPRKSLVDCELAEQLRRGKPPTRTYQIEKFYNRVRGQVRLHQQLSIGITAVGSSDCNGLC